MKNKKILGFVKDWILPLAYLALAVALITDKAIENTPVDVDQPTMLRFAMEQPVINNAKHTTVVYEPDYEIASRKPDVTATVLVEIHEPAEKVVEVKKEVVNPVTQAKDPDAPIMYKDLNIDHNSAKTMTPDEKRTLGPIILKCHYDKEYRESINIPTSNFTVCQDMILRRYRSGELVL